MPAECNSKGQAAPTTGPTSEGKPTTRIDSLVQVYARTLPNQERIVAAFRLLSPLETCHVV